jgi:general secretion pathway protein G
MKGGITRMRFYFQQIRDRRRAEGKEAGLIDSGFTLIELLIVIVVLGILAAVVIFALSGVTSSSAVSACNADAKSVEVAAEAYHTQNNGTWPTQAQLTPTYLRTWPNNTAHYSISLDNTGKVYVNAGTGTTQSAATNYDSSTNPCSAIT